jgi:hypothetical protein
VVKVEGTIKAKALAKDLVEAQRLSAAIGDELNWLIRAGAVPLVTDHGFRYGHVADDDLRDALFRLGAGNIPAQGKAFWDMVPDPAPSKLWEAALAALEVDATAALPPA